MNITLMIQTKTLEIHYYKALINGLKKTELEKATQNPIKELPLVWTTSRPAGHLSHRKLTFVLLYNARQTILKQQPDVHDVN